MTQNVNAYKDDLMNKRSAYIDEQTVAYEREDYERCSELQELIDELDSML